ncbi:DUF2911 domain-containing protein [Tenacibaculum jejuense]|uniref:Asparagine synthetase B n=1 Tax=Tenacibaculum jejuense TaxID=584609 RepID=A0A238U6F1_9FLAO|nr:DUF2911 domain-containing protein [Tenacibaculum jejuense]SNR14064.1 conserved exported protein of unknown function [Tenacibaculum jejuense]
MKKSILSIVVFALALVFSNNTFGQEFLELDKSPMDASVYPTSKRVLDKLIKVVYSRPYLKGRPLAKLVPEGKVWRTGANEAAEIIFYKDVTFGGKPVKAGTYSLFAIPGDKEWTIILNTTLNVWGSYFYKESEDVVRVKGKVSTSKKSLENFSIVFDGKGENANMHLGWGTTVVSVPIKG